eukprot:6208808-Pleurochrysis_carterae.AAC.1
MDEVQEGPGGVGPSQLPERHELEDRDEAELGSDSGKTEATDDDFTALARNDHDNTAAPMRPITLVTGFRFDQGWHVRLCQTPEIGAPLPVRTRALGTSVALEPRFDQDTIFSTFAARLLLGGEDVVDYAANKGYYYTPQPPPIYTTRTESCGWRSRRTTTAE